MTNRPAHYNTKYKEDLTPREKDIIALVAKGKTNAEIAHELGLALETVKWHVGGVLGKLGVDSREEAAACWRSSGAFGGRLGRGWNAVVGAFAGKAALAGAAVAVVAAGAIVVIAVALALNSGDSRERLETGPGGPEPRVGQPIARIPYPFPFGDPVVAGGALWAATGLGVVRVDLHSHGVTAIPETEHVEPAAFHVWNLTAGGGQIWTAAGDGHGLLGLDPATGKIMRRIEFDFEELGGAIWLLGTDDGLYVSALQAGRLFRLDLASGKTVGEVQLHKLAWGPPVMAAGSLWIPLGDTGEVARVDPTTLQTLAVIQVRADAEGCACELRLVAAIDSVWALAGSSGASKPAYNSPAYIGKVDLATNSFVTVLRFDVPITESPAPGGGGIGPIHGGGLAIDQDGDIWVAGSSHGSPNQLFHIDNATSQVVETIPLNLGRSAFDFVTPVSVVADGDTLWVLTREGASDLVPVRRKP